MFFLILITMALILLSMKYIKLNNISKRIIIFYSIFTCGLLLISTLNPVGLYPVSNTTYILWLVSILCIVALIILVDKKHKSENESENENDGIDLSKILNSKFLLIIECVISVLLFCYLIKYLSIIRGISHEQIRLARYDHLFYSSFETLFYNYVISGIVSIFNILFVILLLNKEYKNKHFYIMLINIVMYMFIGFERISLLEILVYIFIAVIILKDIKKILNKRNLRILLALIVIIITIFFVMIFIRMKHPDQSIGENIKSTSINLFNQIFEYPLGGFRMFDNFIKNGFEGFNKYTYGRATFAGLEEIVLYPIKGVGLEIDSFNNIIGDSLAKATQIGENTTYFNAFYSGIMNFYFDFGMIGVVIFSVMHGLLIGVCINQYKKNKTIYSLMLLMFIIKNLIFTVFSWPYQSGTTVFILIILLAINIFNNIRRRNIQNESIMDSK